MRVTRKIRRNARRLFRLCLADGVVDEERARRVTKRIAEGDRRDRWIVLRSLGRLLKRNREHHSALVESAAELSPELRERVLRDLTKMYGPGLTTSFSERPDLIGGMRIRVGDDIYDGTVKARLAALERTL